MPKVKELLDDANLTYKLSIVEHEGLTPAQIKLVFPTKQDYMVYKLQGLDKAVESVSSSCYAPYIPLMRHQGKDL